MNASVGATRMGRYAERQGLPDVVIGGNDQMAIAVMNRALESQLARPAGFACDRLQRLRLLTQAGRVRLGNMVDPKYTLGASILKKYLS